MLDAVSKEKFAAEIGVSTGTIEGWMQRHWTRGEEYKVIGRTTLIIVARAMEWIGRQESSPEGEDWKSASGAASGASTRRQSPATRTPPLLSPVR